MSPAAICPLVSPVAAAVPVKIPFASLTNSAPSQSVGTNAPPALPFTFHTSSNHPYRIPSVDSGLLISGTPALVSFHVSKTPTALRTCSTGDFHP